MLLSITGAMLVASASDLIWLFLALELTSLPTYVMVVMGRAGRRGAEASVKYFFLGDGDSHVPVRVCFGVRRNRLHATCRYRRDCGQSPQLGRLGHGHHRRSLVGPAGGGLQTCCCTAALYAMDVYEGASASVTAFLGFVPKAAGTIAFMVLLQTAGGKAFRPWWSR